ncbi:hypothetical protein FA13DRAFT_1744688 [Coprinellus micaceus]|uniref:Uncharacterized protein n=1 Tax=Coprinellus micaceus TaxID=71717 RepID=A0A4Y7SCD9_COPMI|nr:hypothetical protein FA13DRAFT_1744688 [Coprinellus micaceus]
MERKVGVRKFMGSRVSLAPALFCLRRSQRPLKEHIRSSVLSFKKNYSASQFCVIFQHLYTATMVSDYSRDRL